VNAICGDCFANAAIRSRFVDTLSEFRCIRRVSQVRFHDPTPRFPPPAPAGGGSPASTVLSRRYDFLPPIPPRFVAFARQYLGVHSFFSLLGGRVRRRGPELITRYLQPGVCRGNGRISQVPGEPQSFVCTCSRDAGRTAVTRPLRCSSVAPVMPTARAPAKGLSALNSTASELAVYASQRRLPGRHARLASGRWSGATGRAFHPQGSAERFQIYISFPFPKLAWRNGIAPRRLMRTELSDRARKNRCGRALTFRAFCLREAAGLDFADAPKGTGADAGPTLGEAR
jgi:hypothetical protein